MQNRGGDFFLELDECKLLVENSSTKTSESIYLSIYIWVFPIIGNAKMDGLQ